MPKRPSLTDITSLTNSSAVNLINTNWDAIQESFDNTLSRDGSTPNVMNADLDLNGNALLNVGTIDADNLTLEGQTITDISAVPEWRGAWLTGTSYVKRDMVKTNGNVYICLVSHTSGTFSTDLTASKWDVMVTKGDSGAGTGDLLSTNNLSDVANSATARANLGLGLVAVENVAPISKGGTGATDAATARSNLGLAIGTNVQAYDAALGSLAGLSLASGDILYATGADTLARLAVGTAGQQLQVNAGGTALEYFTPTAPSGGMDLLATITTSSGSSQSATSLDLTSYKSLRVVFRCTYSSGGTGNLLVAGTTVYNTANNADVLRGHAFIDLVEGTMTSFVAPAANSITQNRSANTTIDTATTSIAFSWSAGNFNGGQILLYGEK